MSYTVEVDDETFNTLQEFATLRRMSIEEYIAFMTRTYPKHRGREKTYLEIENMRRIGRQ